MKDATPLPSPSRSCIPQGYWERWMLGLLAIGILQRLVRYGLGFPIWGDEAFICLNVLDRDFSELAGRLRFDQVAPLLFLWTEKTALDLLGTSEWSLRLFPLLAGIGGLLLFASLARSVLRPTGALLALGALAVAYYPVRHACEVKPYASDLFAAVLLLSLGAACIRRPRVEALGLLCLSTPFALSVSYPAVFIAGSVSLALLPGILRCKNWQLWGLFALFHLLMLGTFVALFLLVGQSQHGSMMQGSSGYWDAWFPPQDLLSLPRWLVLTHTGNLLAYPIGGRDGASAATLVLCLVGVWSLLRRQRYRLLTLLLCPFALTLLAAFLGKYPYGGSARVAQHLAPSICLLFGAGLATVISKTMASVKMQQRALILAVMLLLTLGVGGIMRDCFRPYKTREDLEARAFVRQTLAQADSQGVVAVVNPPAQLYPSLEWYLRALGGDRVSWSGVHSSVGGAGAANRLITLQFQVNQEKMVAFPAEWAVPDGLFVQEKRAWRALNLGTMPLVTDGCEVVWWQRSNENGRLTSEETNRPRLPFDLEEEPSEKP